MPALTKVALQMAYACFHHTVHLPYRALALSWQVCPERIPDTTSAGLLYLRMGTTLPGDLADRVSGLWFSLAIVMFTPSFTALVVWDKERLLLRRESATGALAGRSAPS